MKYRIILLLLISIRLLGATDFFDIEAGSFLKVNIDSLKVAAFEAYQNQNYEVAAANYLRYLQYNVTDAGNIYNLACCYGLMGNEKLATHYLRIAYQKGYRMVDHFKEDVDFDPVRKGPIFSAFMDSLAAQHKPDTQQRIGVSSNHLTQALVRMPEDFDFRTSYPLIVALHGYGDNAENFSKLFASVSDCIVVTLETAYPLNLGKTIGYSWSMHTPDAALRDQSFVLSADQVAQCIQDIKQQYRISRVMLTGFSQGGGLTFLTTMAYPELIDLAVPIAGFYPDELLTDEMLTATAAANIPFIICHGTDDRAVAIDNTYNAEKALTAAGMQTEIHTYPGGHSVNYELLYRIINDFKMME